MSLEVRWLTRARKDLKRLDPPVQERVIQAIEEFSQTGIGDVRRLAGYDPAEYRLRVGAWRVRFAREDRILYVLQVLHRGKAYR